MVDIEPYLRKFREFEKKMDDRFKAIERRLDAQYEETKKINKRLDALERKSS